MSGFDVSKRRCFIIYMLLTVVATDGSLVRFEEFIFYRLGVYFITGLNLFRTQLNLNI